jgi:hypothetical protein
MTPTTKIAQTEVSTTMTNQQLAAVLAVIPPGLRDQIDVTKVIIFSEVIDVVQPFPKTKAKKVRK